MGSTHFLLGAPRPSPSCAVMSAQQAQASSALMLVDTRG